MNVKEKRKTVGMVGMVGFLLATGIYAPHGVASPSDQSIGNGEPMDKGIQLTQKRDNPPDTPPVVPPTNDSEMVIKPETPPDPDAVVTPPIIDPKMAVDPTTRQPMTPEKLDRLTPEELEKGIPGEEKK